MEVLPLGSIKMENISVMLSKLILIKKYREEFNKAVFIETTRNGGWLDSRLFSSIFKSLKGNKITKYYHIPCLKVRTLNKEVPDLDTHRCLRVIDFIL
jgi:hypothetical protein